MTKSSQAGKHRGKAHRSAPHGSPVATKGVRPKHGALGPNRKALATMDGDDKKILMRQSSVAPRAEPSTNGAKQWTSGRKQVRKHR